MLLMSSLWIGATVTIVPIFDAAAVLDTWLRSGATFYIALPTLVRALLTEQPASPRPITSGRLVICGGDTVPVSLQEEYAAVFRHPMVEGFGMTEGLPIVANSATDNRPGSMGRPAGDIEIRVVDGELCVRGGSNISPQEVEETLYQHPSVAEVGVIGETDAYWGEKVVAFVVLREGHTASVEQLVSFCRSHLAEYKCPERVLFLDALPKGPTGKVQRRVLKELRAEAAIAR